MTKKQLAKLTPDEKRAKIAEARGWTDVNFYEDNQGPGYWNGYPPPIIGLDASGEWDIKKEKYHKPLPDYPNDLNACHEFEMSMTEEQRVRYRLRLSFLSDGPNAKYQTVDAALCHSTAAQRADAFLLTIL